ncbi:MAG: eL32 family ribosomal protein [Candidatus Anstonellaceae archaeon]
MLKKKKKPKFFRPNYGRSSRKRIKANWRRPRGVDNKKRIKKAYMGASPSIGYSQNKKIRGLHPSGKKEVLVSNLSQLNSIGNDFAIRIASNVGRKLRLKIFQVALDKKLKVLNPPKTKEEK